MSTPKIEHFVGGEVEPFRHANTFAREKTTGPERLRIGPRGGHAYLVEMLAQCAEPPYKLLYVLHTTRTGATLGRYESPWLELPELQDFFKRFGDFLAQDSRHDLWLLGAGTKGTIVWDRHDLVYAYGPLERYITLLEAGGFREGWPSWPVPHVHHYHEEWDDAERLMLKYFEWIRTDLRREDRQIITDE
jgi:hypothetical protein